LTGERADAVHITHSPMNDMHTPADTPVRANSAFLQATGITKAYGVGAEHTVALGNIDLDVAEGEFLAVVGPSGCGKSTLLQIIAGLMPSSEGRVVVDSRPVDGPPENMVYLFQQYTKSLFPWRRVIDNVAFAVEHRQGMSRARAREHSRRFLDMVGLADSAMRYPQQLSGGMQQRVAIARALAAEPRVLLMDEPFSSVDALTRMDLHNLILELWTRQRFTAVLVTHDVDEAVYLADRVAVLSARPSSIVRSIPTALPRPRDSIVTRELPRFVELRHELLEMLLGRAPADANRG
jgi:NitT/TauT family transport system ATP-binding protein